MIVVAMPGEENVGNRNFYNVAWWFKEGRRRKLFLLLFFIELFAVHHWLLVASGFQYNGVGVLPKETGEHMIVAIGEVHLERCLLDLRTVFAQNIEFRQVFFICYVCVVVGFVRIQ